MTIIINGRPAVVLNTLSSGLGAPADTCQVTVDVNRRTYCARNFRGTLGVDLHKCSGGRMCKGGCKARKSLK